MMEFPIALEIPSKYWVRLNDLNNVTSYLWLNWMCRVLIGQSYLIAWVWILAIAIAIGPLFVRSITKNYLCCLISGWSIFWLVEIIKLEQQCCHLLIGPLLFFCFLEKQLLKIADEGNLILFCLKNVVYYKLHDNYEDEEPKIFWHQQGNKTCSRWKTKTGNFHFSLGISLHMNIEPSSSSSFQSSFSSKINQGHRQLLPNSQR